mmetsp:Transcript_51957/g.122900  ORF Transcript_51957/g.122900 Transcript_51957/m.122900 type:complete len:274 (-) Transcript_51957:535-1356(-)
MLACMRGRLVRMAGSSAGVSREQRRRASTTIESCFESISCSTTATKGSSISFISTDFTSTFSRLRLRKRRLRASSARRYSLRFTFPLPPPSTIVAPSLALALRSHSGPIGGSFSAGLGRCSSSLLRFCCTTPSAPSAVGAEGVSSVCFRFFLLTSSGLLQAGRYRCAMVCTHTSISLAFTVGFAARPRPNRRNTSSYRRRTLRVVASNITLRRPNWLASGSGSMRPWGRSSKLRALPMSSKASYALVFLASGVLAWILSTSFSSATWPTSSST